MNFKPNMLFLNRSFDKKRLKALLLWFRLNLSENAALKAVEILQGLGFRSATQGAISLGLDDLKTPTSKGGRVFQAQVEVALAHHEHHRGNRTPVELFQHLVDTWHRTSQDLTTEVVQLFHSTERVNPVYMMAFSGARGNISQVRQLVGMRGLMADPRGQIVGFPILSNFREGLTITEYFVSCYGARKGVVDTAIRTADAGYLTRRLADVSHHVVVRTTNCGTHESILLRDIKEGQKTILSLTTRLVGRVLAEHVFLPASPTSNSSVSHDLPHSYASPSSLQSSDFLVQQYEKSEAEGTSFDEDKTKTIIYRNSEITSPLASKLAAHYLEVPVRSPLSCSLPWGVCQLCYGWGLSEGRRVTLGEAVGIIAAQSIGEPGTQLTLRTFHTGGVFSGELLNEIRAPYNGNVIFPTPLQGLLLRTPHGQIAFLTKVSGKMNISETEMRFESKRENLDTSILLQQSKGNSFFSKFNKTTDSSAMYTSESCNSGQSTEKLTNQRSQDALLQQHSATQLRKPLPLQGTGVKLRKPLPLCEAKGTGIKVMDGKECEKDMMRRLPKHEDLFEKKQIDKINDTKNELSLPKQDSEFIIQPSTVIFVKQKEHVVNNQLLAEFSSSTLQSVNDQIEITQQVLSDTAGQIWFKELEYGNRKGPGSGSLGTYFSSQKLGGIWVLAGKPMIDINPSFVSPPPSFSTQSKEEAGVPYAVPYKGKGLFHQLSAITRVNPYPLEVGAVAKDTLLRDAPYPCVQSKPYMGKGLLPLYPLHTPYGVSTRVRAFTPVPFAYSLRSKHKGKGSAALPLWGQQLTAMVRESSHYPCLNLQFRQQSGSYVNDFRGAEVKTCTRVSSEYKTKSFFNLAPRPAKESENEKFIPFKGRQAGLTKQGYGYQRFAKSLKSFIPLVTIVRGKQKLQLQIEDLSENTLSSNIIKEGINNGRSPSTNVFINTNLLLHENKISFSNNCDKFLVFNNFVLRNLNKSPKINKSLLKRKNLFKYHTYGIQNKLKRAINTRYSKTCTTSIINLQNNYDYSLKSSGLLRENVFKYDYILGYSQAANSKTPSIYFSRKATSQNNSKSLLFKYHKNNKFLIDTRQEKDLESQTIDKSIKCHYSQPAMDSVGVKAPYVQSKATQLRKPLPLQGTGVKLRKPLPLCLLHKEYAKGMLRILLRSKQSVALQGVKTQYSAYTNGRNFLTSTNQRFVRKADAYKSSICTYKLPVVVVRRSLPFVRFVQQALWGKQSRKALLLQYVQNKAGISSQEQRAFTPVPFAYSLRSKHKGKGSVAEKQRGTRITHDKFFEKIENKIKKNTLVFQELRSYESQFTLGKTRKSTKKLNMLPLLSEGDLVTFVTNSDHNHTQCKLNAVQVRAFLDVKGKNKKPMGLACKGMAKSCFAIENVISFPPIPVLSPLTPYFNKTSFSFSTPYPLQSYANKSYLSTVLINKDITRIHPCDNRKTITCKAMDNLIKSNPPATARNTLPIIARDTPPIIAKDTLINCFVSQGNKSSYFVTEKRRLQSTWIQKKRAYLTYLNQVSSIPFTQQFSKCTNEYTAEAFTNFISRTNIQLSTFRISSKNFTSHYLTSKIYKPLSNIIKASASDPLPLCLLRKEYAKGTGVKLRKPLPLCLLRKEYAKGIGVKTLWGKNNETTIITNGLSLGDNTPPAGDTVPVMARELPPAMARELPPAMARELPPAVIKKNFLGENKRTPLFPGQLVTYGDNIANNIVSTESGQVLYIDSQKTTLRKAQTVLIYSRAIIAVLSGDWIKKGTPLMSLSYQKLVTGDIVQGLPKIEQFFEAPVLRDGTFWSDSLQAKLNQFFQEEREKLPLAEAVRKGFSEIQRVLVEGVLRVYISQGVLIADKHLEVIVRQMTCKGRILYSGDTGFLRNELVSLDKIENVNQVTYGQKALYHPQVRGITDASLESESFLSAASFQETTRVLSRDAIIGKTDLMRGLKERVIVGELIQAGTGLANNSVYNLLAHSVT